MPVIETDEDRWRTALTLVGADQIRTQLAQYPGRPTDPIWDLPLKPPYPSRAFCLEWCDESDARWFRPYTRAIVALIVLAVTALSYASCTLSTFLGSPSSSVMPTISTPSMYQPSLPQAGPVPSPVTQHSGN
jgi:hypothetical protein